VDENSDVIPAALDKTIAGLRALGDLTPDSDKALSYTALLGISQCCVDKLVYEQNLATQVTVSQQGVNPIEGLPSFTSEESRVVVGDFDQQTCNGMYGAFESATSERCLGWLISHGEEGNRRWEFHRPENLVARTLYSSDFDEGWVVGRIREGVANPQVFMVYADSPTPEDYYYYTQASERIHEHADVPVYLAGAKRLSGFEAGLRAYGANESAPADEVGKLLKLCGVVVTDYNTRTWRRSLGMPEGNNSQVVGDRITGRVGYMRDYITRRFQQQGVAEFLEGQVMALAGSMKQMPGGGFAPDDEQFIAYTCLVDVAQAAFMTGLVWTGAVNEVDFVDQQGGEVTRIPLGSHGLEYMNTVSVLSGGREHDDELPNGVRALAGLALDYGENAGVFKPLGERLAAEGAGSASDLTAARMRAQADIAGPILARRLLSSGEADGRMCAVIVGGSERELVCSEALPPQLNRPEAVKAVIESIFTGDLRGKSDLDRLRVQVNEEVHKSTGVSFAPDLVSDEHRLGVHCDEVAHALRWGVGSACERLGREATAAVKMSNISAKELTTALKRQGIRRPGKADQEAYRKGKREETAGKRELVETLTELAEPLRPADDEALIKREVVSEALGGFMIGEVQAGDVTSLAQDLGMEDYARQRLGEMVGGLRAGVEEVSGRKDALITRLGELAGGADRLEGARTLEETITVVQKAVEAAKADELLIEMAGGDYTTFHDVYGEGSPEEDKQALCALPLGDMNSLCSEHELDKQPMLLLFWMMDTIGNDNLTVGGVRQALEELSGKTENPIHVASPSSEIQGDGLYGVGESEYADADGKPLYGLILNVDKMADFSDGGLHEFAREFPTPEEQKAEEWRQTCAQISEMNYSDFVGVEVFKQIVPPVRRLPDQPAQANAREMVKQYCSWVNIGDPAAEGLACHIRLHTAEVGGRDVRDNEIPELAREYVLADRIGNDYEPDNPIRSRLDEAALETVQLSDERMIHPQKQRYDTLVGAYGSILSRI